MAEQLLYAFDPLCGWCFGFRPVMRAIRQKYPDLTVRLKCGGLVVGDRVAPIRESHAYLVAGLEQVRQRTGERAGRQFFDSLLAQGEYISDSEPPCRAIWAFEQLATDRVEDRTYDYADALCWHFYGEGRALDDVELLRQLAQARGVDGQAFADLWRSPQAKSAVQQRFGLVRSEGFVSYPTLVYENSGIRTLIASGWCDVGVVTARIDGARR